MKQRRCLFISYIFCLLCIPGAAYPETQDKPIVFASIRPLALIVQDLVGDQADIQVLVSGSESPHDFSLTIGQAFALNEADLLVWNGPGFERFLVRGVTTRKKIALDDALAHQHQGITHENHNIHAWLNTRHSREFANTLSKHLKVMLPGYAPEIDKRRTILQQGIDQQKQNIETTLSPYREIPFMVFHDGYGEFIAEFGLTQAASLTSASHELLSAKRLIEIGNKTEGLACLLAEKAEEAKAKRYANMFDLRLEIVDLLATDSSTQSFPQYLAEIASAFKRCIGNSVKH